MIRFLSALLLAVALIALARPAFADKVAVLSFTSSGRATSQQLDEARDATRLAVTQRSHTQPNDSELLTAQMSTRDGVADTRSEYRSAGRASGSAWTVAGHVDHRGDTYRLELEACQVESGRVESLVREISPAVAPAQIGEMLGYLLRPEGIGNAEIAWKVAGPPPAAKPEPIPPPPPKPPEPPPVRHAFGDQAPLGIGVGVDALAALQRPINARGSGASLRVHGAVTYAIAAVPGLDLRGDVGVAVAGPQALHATAGARYLFPIAPSLRVYAGPEVGLGGFFTLGAEKTSRFLLHGALVGAIGIGARGQIEVAGEVDYAAGGSGGLLLGGASLRGVVRF